MGWLYDKQMSAGRSKKLMLFQSGLTFEMVKQTHYTNQKLKEKSTPHTWKVNPATKRRHQAESTSALSPFSATTPPA